MTYNGCVVKFVRFIGKSAHAGGAPHNGINALKAAMLALQAIDAQRETFRDEDHIRVHPIITRGGDAVSAIPADVRLETFVRGSTLKAIQDAHEGRPCLRAGAIAMGATSRSQRFPATCRTSRPEPRGPRVRELRGDRRQGPHGDATTRDGLHGRRRPRVHHADGAPALGRDQGRHRQGTSDYVVVDHHLAAVNPAKSMAMMVDRPPVGRRPRGRARPRERPARS